MNAEAMTIPMDHPEFDRIQCTTKAAMSASQKLDTPKREGFTFNGHNYWIDEKGACFMRSLEVHFDMPASPEISIDLQAYQNAKNNYFAELRGKNNFCC